MYNENELLDTTKELVIEGATFLGDITPFVGSFVTNIKLKRFEKRIKKHETRILKIFSLLSENDVDFVAEKIGVPVFEKIMQDQEDDKAEFLLLGFENCVKNNIKDEDLIVYYLDLISDLRVLDLKRLVAFSGRTDVKPIVPEKDSKEELLLHASDEKLNRLGLIQVKMGWSSENGNQINYAFPIELTRRGMTFLDFIGF